jgi:ribosomal protein S18 acetylase RimI-like enzyme
MENTIVIRECSEADIDAVLALWGSSAAPHSFYNSAEGIALRLTRDRELFVLAVDGDHIVGSLMGGWDGWRGILYRMAVAPEYRRQRIATRLLDEVERRLAALGCQRVHASVIPESPGATAFWAAAGYETQPQIVEHAKNIGGAS